MPLPPNDLSWFSENLAETVQEIVDAWTDAGGSATFNQAPPEMIQEALEQLVEVLRLSNRDQRLTPVTRDESAESVDISELGGYGLNMLTELSQITADLRLGGLSERLEQLAVSLAFWVIGQGGELSSVELVVNGLARIANSTLDALELERLFVAMSDVLDAIPPGVLQQRPAEPEQQPWQLLLLNRAIVATRSLSPLLMETAFSDVAEHLPETAPGFFREGMEQIKLRGYPEPVAAIIERYYREWPAAKTLH